MAWFAAAAPYIVTAVGTAATVGGQIQSGRAQQKIADMNAEQAEREAEIAKRNAERDEAQFRREGERLKAIQRARYAKSGVQMTSESPLLVMEETAAEIERDALAIRYGGDIAAARANSQARLDRFTGKQARTSSYYAAGGSLLTGASNVYKTY